ncbi:hypothetical protein CEXT_805081 [Caerostris extrusa]|uniref:Uncharacterized protein n=1 Tax=Caerostris extrusa TaxID=172846 RepID=A0AAV4PIG4_CAEEX|nr:hypothetical protein CEXT_805081 [Caerostris extrusa]
MVGHAGFRPAHVLGGSSGPQLCLSGTHPSKVSFFLPDSVALHSSLLPTETVKDKDGRRKRKVSTKAISDVLSPSLSEEKKRKTWTHPSKFSSFYLILSPSIFHCFRPRRLRAAKTKEEEGSFHEGHSDLPSPPYQRRKKRKTWSSFFAVKVAAAGHRPENNSPDTLSPTLMGSVPCISNHGSQDGRRKRRRKFPRRPFGRPVSLLIREEERKKEKLVIICRSQGRCLRRCRWTQAKEQFPEHTSANFDGKHAPAFQIS